MSQRGSNQDQSPRRALPSVDRALRELGETGLPRSLVVAVIRTELADLRATLAAQRDNIHPASHAPDAIEQIRAAVERLRRARLRKVINGAGIIIHTNLGRSPLADEAIDAIARVARNYSNLEYDLSKGQRGGRANYLEQALATLCGDTCAATVVNNCAAAIFLALHHFTATQRDRNEVIVSRGELVQIGGGFRIPEILQASGARLREVGTTNQTSLEDYARAITPHTAMILKVHRSNFYMDGFVSAPSTAQLSCLAQQHNLPLLEDLGSGATFDTATLGGDESEPTPRTSLAAGADLVAFSGDKLLGGPQAGIIAGKPHLIAALKHNPLFRALRCDKLVLAALEATINLHLAGQTDQIPIFQMMRLTPADLQPRASAMISALANLPVHASVGRGHSQMGGGSLPRTKLPSITLDLEPMHLSPDELSQRLLLHDPAVIGYISNNRFRLDLRTIFPDQDLLVIEAIKQALT
jgi:L-seryl-tRNA(Ser) seleniumtransferase